MRYIELIKGNSYNLQVRVTTNDDVTGDIIGKDIGTVTEIIYYLAKSSSSAALITQRLSEDTIKKTEPTNGMFTVGLGKDALAGLKPGLYYHECVLQDADGFQAVVMSESVTIKESIIL